MATSSLLGRRLFLTAAQRSSWHTSTSRIVAANVQRQALLSTVASQQQSFNNSDNNAAFFRFGLLAAAGAAATLTAVSNDSSSASAAKCCGIAGVVGAKGDARDYLIEGLTILKNRGYDSAGIATMDDSNPSLVSDWS
jgi:glucosamine--fructose-6-phosphate aminotransferase (isomerizing)